MIYNGAITTLIKSIFIAGNESFAQGPIDFQEAAKLAVQHGISINTIHAGGHEKGFSDNWQAGAFLASGSYMSINSNQKIVHIEPPQDKRIAELNAQLNTTYLPYGHNGEKSAQRQIEQDTQSSRISAGLLSKRVKTKSSSFYSNAHWDLIDALHEGEVKASEISKIEDKHLPDSMKGLSSTERLEHIRQKEKERRDIKQEFEEQTELRATYVAKIKREQIGASPTMSDALTKAIKKQAEEKNHLRQQIRKLITGVNTSRTQQMGL
jgi:hypothetical protein